MAIWKKHVSKYVGPFGFNIVFHLQLLVFIFVYQFQVYSNSCSNWVSQVKSCNRPACGHVDVMMCPHQVLAPTFTLSQPGGQILSTLYWCPHQVLQATSAPELQRCNLTRNSTTQLILIFHITGLATLFQKNLIRVNHTCSNTRLCSPNQ